MTCRWNLFASSIRRHNAEVQHGPSERLWRGAGAPTVATKGPTCDTKPIQLCMKLPQTFRLSLLSLGLMRSHIAKYYIQRNPLEDLDEDAGDVCCSDGGKSFSWKPIWSCRSISTQVAAGLDNSASGTAVATTMMMNAVRLTDIFHINESWVSVSRWRRMLSVRVCHLLYHKFGL